MSLVVVGFIAALSILFAVGAYFDKPSPTACKDCGTPEEDCIKSGGCCGRCHTNKTLHHSWGQK